MHIILPCITIVQLQCILSCDIICLVIKTVTIIKFCVWDLLESTLSSLLYITTLKAFHQTLGWIQDLRRGGGGVILLFFKPAHWSVLWKHHHFKGKLTLYWTPLDPPVPTLLFFPFYLSLFSFFFFTIANHQWMLLSFHQPHPFIGSSQLNKNFTET